MAVSIEFHTQSNEKKISTSELNNKCLKPTRRKFYNTPEVCKTNLKQTWCSYTEKSIKLSLCPNLKC